MQSPFTENTSLLAQVKAAMRKSFDNVRLYTLLLSSWFQSIHLVKGCSDSLFSADILSNGTTFHCLCQSTGLCCQSVVGM